MKKKAQDLRKAYKAYSNAALSFSPPQTVLTLGNHYIETIRAIYFDKIETAVVDGNQPQKTLSQGKSGSGNY